MTIDHHSAVKSADRVLDILELVSRHRRNRRDLSHSEIADYLNIPKGSLTPLLRNLVARGYLELSPNGRGYRLGEAFLAFSQDSPDLASRALPFMTELTRETGESCALNEPRGTDTEVVASVTGPGRLVAHMRTGDRAPLYATSGGKAILANLSDAERQDYLENVVFGHVTPQTIRSRKALEQQIGEIRETGFAYSIEEFTPGIVGVAMILRDAQNNPLAALNVVLPALRFNDSTCALVKSALFRAVQAIQRTL